MLARRRRVRSFAATAIDQDWLDARCAEALRAPSAGNTAGVRMYSVGAAHVGDYLRVATDERWRESAPRFAGLSRAGAVVLVTTRPQDYLSRYGEEDKSSSGLDDPSAWTIPYWYSDAGMAMMALLLLLEEASLAATLWGNFRRGTNVLAWAGVEDEELVASILRAHADGSDWPSRSLAREVAPRTSRVARVPR